MPFPTLTISENVVTPETFGIVVIPVTFKLSNVGVSDTVMVPNPIPDDAVAVILSQQS